MIRLNRLIRLTQINKTAIRGGVPGWDRPDPPVTAFNPRKQMFTHFDYIFEWGDHSMSEHIMTVPQIYEGTTFQAMPQILTKWGAFIFIAFAAGTFFTMFSHAPRTYRQLRIPQKQQKIKIIQNNIKNKTTLQLVKSNPFGINVESQLFPYIYYGQWHYPPGYYYDKTFLNTMYQIHADAKAFWARIEKKAQQELNKQHH